MKSILMYVAVLLFSCGLSAQSSLGGFPKGLGKTQLPTLQAVFKLPDVNEEALLAEDALLAQNGEKSLRFGQDIHVDISPSSHGQWDRLPNGASLWRLKIKSVDAKAILVIFDLFRLKEGERLFIYAPDGSHIMGAFSQLNNNRISNFSTLPLQSSEMIIELEQPEGYPVPELHISYLVHAYRDFNLALKDFGGSGACNNNVICPEGNDWVDQRNSVAMILTSNNSRFCTGALVNNTANDGTPYFLTADHCDVGSTDIFMFNYWSPVCTPNTDGPTSDVVSGCIPRASNPGSDMALVELASDIPAEFNAYLSGWSRQNTPPSSSVSIHHPDGDVMKITFNDDVTLIDDFGGADCWHIPDWEDGTTEPGSSGSPLFNENKLIIGQLYGGTANCSNNIDDYYGRFVTSWDGNSAATRLRDWLDPSSLNPQTLDGRPASLPSLAIDLRLSSILTPAAEYCNVSSINPEITVRNSGIQEITSFTVEYSFGNSGILTYNWQGNLASLQSTNVVLPSFNMGPGLNQLFTATLVNPNNTSDNDPANNQRSVSVNVAQGAQYALEIESDNYPEETSWQLLTADTEELIASIELGDLPQGTTTYNWCLSPGCYKFIIEDEVGDGICCGFFVGNGSYTVFDDQGTELGSGGAFEFSEEVDFCVDTALGFIPVYDNAKFVVYPNPASDLFSIISVGNLNDTAAIVEVFDITGKIVVSTTLGASGTSISSSEWIPGMYLVRINHSGRQYLKKIIINE